jgi:Fe-S cluster biosynthesis and repair protein YggX
MQFVNENFAFRTLLTDFVLSRLEHAVAGGLLNPPLPIARRPIPPQVMCDNFQGKSQAMSEHKVFCAKLKQELPGLSEPPFDTDLGKKVYEQISQKAWDQWMEYCKMLLNEYRLNPARKQDQEVIVKQMEQFFFGEGAAPPAQYVPPTH